MIEPHVHIAYAPQGAGVLCAMFWFERGHDVYGWFTGARAYEQEAAFFMLENYRSAARTVVFRSVQSNVYGDWLLVTQAGASPIDPPVPVPEPLCHELERLQDAFVREWLFYADDAGHERDGETLTARGLPVLGINVRPGRINKLSTGGPVWTYTSPNADANIPAFLGRYWPLEYEGR